MLDHPRQLKTESRSVLELIGNTPLLSFRRVTRNLRNVEVYGKAEWYNPGGSVKDRAAMAMVLDGERRGLLTKDKILIDATSGNTGIAYAMICALKGYRAKLCLPANASHERKQILKAYGAEMVFSDPGEGSDGAIRLCQKIFAEGAEKYFYPDQYGNSANWRAHFEGTGAEIIKQTDGRVTHFVTSMGTSGTFTGTSRRLKRDVPGVKCISAQPSSGFHGLEGLKHMPTAIVPAIYDPTLADDNLWIETEDAYAMTRWLGRHEGLLVGMSSGANVHAAREVGKKLAAAGQSGVIVTVLADGATKYLSESFWND